LGASNWGGQAPSYSDDAFIANSGTASIATNSVACNSLTLSNSSTLNMLNGGFSSSYFGLIVDGDSSVQMSGGNFFLEGYIGYTGRGTFNQSGGTCNVSFGQLMLGNNVGSSGTFNLSGSGQLISGGLTVSSTGTGNFVQSGGTVSLGAIYSLFVDGTGTTVYRLSNGQLSAYTETMGDGSTGSFIQSGGTNTVTDYLQLAHAPGSFGSYSLNGGLLILPQLIQGSGSAVFNFNGGTLQAGSGGFATLVPMTLGNSGGGATFDTAGHAMGISGSLAGPGNLNVAGTGILSLTQDNTFSGVTLVSGGTLRVQSTLALQQSTLDTNGAGNVGFQSITSATLGGLTGNGSLNLVSRIGGLHPVLSPLALSVGNNDESTTYSGFMTGPGSLIKIGLGTLDLRNAESYSGSTTVNQGELLVNGSLTSPVTVNSGATIGGAGSLSSVIVNAGGHLAPGDSPGTLTLSGSLSLLTGAVMDYELATPLTGDEVSMPTSLLSLNGQQFSDFNISPLAGFGDGTYTLIDAGSISGGLGNNVSGAINGHTATLSIHGNDVVLTVVSEPGTLLLLAANVFACASGLCFRRRGWPRKQA
jgi:autotransporter-associated beta strand protein